MSDMIRLQVLRYDDNLGEKESFNVGGGGSNSGSHTTQKTPAIKEMLQSKCDRLQMRDCCPGHDKIPQEVMSL